MTPAAKLQNYLRQRIEAIGGHCRKARWEGRVGCPDCYVWLAGGRYAWIEIKVGNDSLSRMQSRELGFMRVAGLRVYTAKTKADIDAIVAELRQGGV